MSAKHTVLMREYKYRDERYILYQPAPSNLCYLIATGITSLLVLITYSLFNYAIGMI